MAWNKPNAANQPVKKSGVKAPFKVKGIVAGLVTVCALGGLCLWLFSGGDNEPKAKPEKERGRIKEVTPAVAPTNRVADAEEKGVRYTKDGRKIRVPKNPWGTPIPKDLEYKPHWEYTAEDYARIDPGYAERHERFLEKKKKMVWKNHVDMRLANLLFSEPGKPSLMMPFRPEFAQQFLKSIQEPIIATKDDPPEVREQKRQMNEAKIWLKDQMDSGKDIVTILNDEVKHQQELRGLHDNLVRELHNIEKTVNDPKEIEDFVAAANKMLEEKGAGKVSFSTKGSQLKIAHRLRMQENKEGAANE